MSTEFSRFLDKFGTFCNFAFDEVVVFVVNPVLLPGIIELDAFNAEFAKFETGKVKLGSCPVGKPKRNT